MTRARNVVLLLLFSALVCAFAVTQQDDRSDEARQEEARREGGSSSKDTKIDIKPPADDAVQHPLSGTDEVEEFHPWDPHKAEKNVEVGDYYFKEKNYRAAESRYREALHWKSNDAVATFRLATALEKLGQFEEARKSYQDYLKILPHGPYSQQAHSAIDRLKGKEGPKQSSIAAPDRSRK